MVEQQVALMMQGSLTVMLDHHIQQSNVHYEVLAGRNGPASLC